MVSSELSEVKFQIVPAPLHQIAGSRKRAKRHLVSLLRSKGLKDATCVGWFGDNWDCSVGFPPEAMDHVSSSVPVGYAV